MKIKLTAFFLLFFNIYSFAQGTLEDYKNAKELQNSLGLVYGTPQQLIWAEDGNSLLYRVKYKDKENYVYLINTISKEKKTLDVTSIARQMSEQLNKDFKLGPNWGRNFKILNYSQLEFDEAGYRWEWDLNSDKLIKLEEVVHGESNSRRYWGTKEDDAKGENITSPDKKYIAYLKNNNVYFSKKGNDNTERQLTFDGSPGDYYAARMLWSNDSKKLAVSRVRKAEIRQVTLLESSPKDQLQPKLKNIDYIKPGDALAQYYPAIIDVESQEIWGVDPAKIANQFSINNIAWRKDNSGITFEFNKRGHQQYDILALNASNGQTDVLISEQSKTFIDYSGKKYRFDHEPANEIIWASERDGWNHLYLFDAKTGFLKNQITKGNWGVRKVIKVDTLSRTIIFEASGMKKGEDPYLVHYYSINFAGKNLKELTPEMANHKVIFNKQHSMFVDTYSLVNQAPVTVLRNASDGRFIMKLEEADISVLQGTGWKAPEVFTAVGRDGETDIWGIIIRPRNFDPQKHYPVIEYIYAGPHSSFVPKSFSTNPSGMYELAELGFIVVQIDGMGTSNRSKAFHDVAWKNLKDSGFPDRISWLKSAAKKYPYMDIERVGIYGTSAGGQSAAAAVLFYPDFYKVAVSSCGCHDNRMDKIWWNEQWMGWPIGPEYAACSNVENAYRLQGKLLLIVGELDDNVDPSSTYQFVNALINEGKDHEFIMVPGMGHSAGGAFGEKKRRDFFVKNLLGVTPPKWSQY